MNSLLKIVKESGINFSGSVIGHILVYAWLMIITRLLSPNEFGTFTLAQSVINISIIFVLFGTPRALDRFIPYYNAAGEQGKTKKLIQYILKTTLALSVIVGIILFLVTGFLSNTLFNNATLSPVLKIMVLSIPLLTFIRIVSSSFIGFKELRYQVYCQQIALPILKIAFTAILLVLGYGLLGWTWMYILSLGGAALLAFWFFRKKILSPLSNITEQSISFRRIFSYSWPLSIASITTILLGQVGIIFLGAFRPSAEIGIYRIYFSIIAILQLGLTSLARIYKPVISEYISQENFGELKNIYKRISKWYIAITFLGFIVILFLGKSIVSILFTREYVVAPLALYILATIHLTNALTGPDSMTLQAFGHTKLVMLNTSLMLLVTVGLGYLLIPSYGIIGAAIATASAKAVGHLAGLLEIYKLHNLQPFSFVHIKYFAAAAVSGLVFYIVSIIIPSSSTISVLGSFIFLVGIYIGSVYLVGGLDDTDFAILRHIKQRLFQALHAKHGTQ